MGMGMLGQVVGVEEATVDAGSVGCVTMNRSLPSLWGSLFVQFPSSDAVISAWLISAALGMVGV